MTLPRDSQKSKVYAGEDEYVTAIVPEAMSKITEMQRWVDGIVSGPWWSQMFPRVRSVQVKDGRRRRSACASYVGDGVGGIKMPRPFRRKIYILHELAHVATESLPSIEPWHGEVFVGRYLALVDNHIGQLQGLALRWFLSKNRVRWQELHRQNGGP